MTDSNREEHKRKMKEVLDEINSGVADNKEDLVSALLILSTTERTAMIAGGHKDDMRLEFGKALVHMIEADPMLLLVMAKAVDVVKRRQEDKARNRHTEQEDSMPEFDPDNVDKDLQAKVEDILGNITKH